MQSPVRVLRLPPPPPQGLYCTYVVVKEGDEHATVPRRFLKRLKNEYFLFSKYTRVPRAGREHRQTFLNSIKNGKQPFLVLVKGKRGSIGLVSAHRSTLGRPSTTVLFVPSVRPRSNPDGTLPPGGPESSEFRPRLRRVYYRTFVDTDFRTTDGRFILLRCSDRRNGICLAFCRAKYGHYTGQTNEKSNVSHAISISTSYKTATHFMRLSYADCLT